MSSQSHVTSGSFLVDGGGDIFTDTFSVPHLEAAPFEIGADAFADTSSVLHLEAAFDQNMPQ